MKGRIASSRSRFGGAKWIADLKVGNIHYYKLEETSGIVGDDSVGNRPVHLRLLDLGITGLIGNAVSSTGGPGGPGGGGDFNSKFLKISKAAINQNALYISTWYYAESDSRFNITSRIDSYDTPSYGYNINVIGSSDTIKVTYYPSYDFPEVSADLNFNQWNHIVIEKTGLTTKVYINNVLKFNDSFTSYNISTTDTFIGVEMTPTGGFYISYKFKLDELGIFSRPLTPGERNILYNNGNGLNLYP